jgi:hypothetical protein
MPRLRMCGAVPQLPLCLHSVVLNLIQGLYLNINIVIITVNCARKHSSQIL